MKKDFSFTWGQWFNIVGKNVSLTVPIVNEQQNDLVFLLEHNDGCKGTFE